MKTEALPYPTDYLEHLEQAALAYLRRHQAKHLGEQVLFSRAVAHLQSTLNANREISENVVARAYGELHAEGDPRYLDISGSTGSMAMLRDPRSGLTRVIPVRTIFERLIDSAARRRLHLVRDADSQVH